MIAFVILSANPGNLWVRVLTVVGGLCAVAWATWSQPQGQEGHDQQRRFSIFDPLDWFRPVSRDERVLEPNQRRLQRERLDKQETLSQSDVAEFVFSTVMQSVSAKHDIVRTLETKATSQMGFAGAILALLVTLGQSNVMQPPFLLAIIALTVCILASLRAVFITEYTTPSPLLYNIPSIASKAENKAKIALNLAEAYGRYGLDVGMEAGRKSRYVAAGSIALFVGIASVFASVFWSGQSRELSIRCPSERCNVTITQGVAHDGKGA